MKKIDIKKLLPGSGMQKSGRKDQAILSKDSSFAFSESYKALRTNLEFITAASDVRTIVVTSALPEESKSTTAVNLAITLAEAEHSVVLVECDMRKPVFRRYLKLDRAGKGLSAFLAGNADIKDSITYVKEKKIHVITAGSLPPNPSELLNHQRMAALIESLKEEYDYVILDAPPVTVVTDAAVLGRMVDGALLVVRSRYAQTKTVKMAKQRLEAVGVKILGAVITRFDMKKSGWRSGYDYEDYNYGYAKGGIK